MKTGFDPLKGRNPVAFQVSSPCFGEMGFGHETILDAQRFAHRRPEIFFNLTRHGKTLMPVAPPVNTWIHGNTCAGVTVVPREQVGISPTLLM